MTISRRRFLKTSMLAGLATVSQNWLAVADEIKDSSDVAPFPVTNADIIKAAQNAELSMLFRGTTLDQARKWRVKFHQQLSRLLGSDAPPKTWTVIEEQRTKFDDHTRVDLVLKSDGIPSVPVYLLIPSKVSEKNPAAAVLCVHGHGAHGHHPIAGRSDLPGVAKSIASANYDYGLQFVRRGYVVAAPCMIPFGRRLDKSGYGRSDPCAITFVRMQALGQLSLTANLRDLRWCIDLLSSRPEVKADRIGCAGLSYGGRMTMMASAMDERIKVAAVSGAFNLLQERISKRYSCGSQIVPGLLKYGDYSEIGSLIAPRPCVWEVGSNDGLITPKWASLFRERLKRIYKAYGVSDNLMIDEFEGGHRWNGEVAFPLFDKVLNA